MLPHLLLFLALLLTPSQQTSILAPESLSLTIYNNNFAMVKDTRSIQFDKGQSTLYFTDVAQFLQPATVTFKALKDPESVRVFQQNFDTHVVTRDGLLKRYVEKVVSLYVDLGDQVRNVTGKLLGYQSGYILETANEGVQTFTNVVGFALPGIPDGFFILPTLSWKVWSRTEQTTSCQVAYRTTGLSWTADYNLVLSQDQKRIQIGGWITLNNKSGKKYSNAQLKFIAGDVNIIQDTLLNALSDAPPKYHMLMSKTDESESLQITEKAFSDYHLYTVNLPITLGENQEKQIQFVPKVYNVSVYPYYRIDLSAGGSPQDNLYVKKFIRFNNSKENGLGFPFPRGRVRSFKEDPQDEVLELLNEVAIKDTPRNENLTLYLGSAPSIIARVVQTSYRSRNNQGGYTAELEMQVTNLRDSESNMEIQFYNYYGSNLNITSETMPEIVSANEWLWTRTLGVGESWRFGWTQSY